jgi:hypothetical protein
MYVRDYQHRDLVAEKILLGEHIASCCGAKDGSCDKLGRYGQVMWLLDKEVES